MTELMASVHDRAIDELRLATYLSPKGRAAPGYVCRVVTDACRHDQSDRRHAGKRTQHFGNVQIGRDAAAVIDHREVDAAIGSGAGPCSGGRILAPGDAVRRVVDALARFAGPVHDDVSRTRIDAPPPQRVVGKPQASLLGAGDIGATGVRRAGSAGLIVTDPVTAKICDGVTRTIEIGGVSSARDLLGIGKIRRKHQTIGKSYASRVTRRSTAFECENYRHWVCFVTERRTNTCRQPQS